MQCEYCSENAIPIDLTNKFACFEKSMISNYFNLKNNVNIANCEKFEINIITTSDPKEYYLSCLKC